MGEPIKTALVGYGLSGKVFHAPFIHAHTGFQLSKVVERNSMYAIGDYPYIKTVRTYQDLLNDAEIELIIVCTPNIYHYQMVKEALEAGKNVVVEKPFMPTSSEADKLIKLADAKGLHIFVYQNRRWDGDFLTIKKIINNNVLGDIRHYEAHFDRYSPERTRAAWRDEEQPGSGNLYDLGSHLIDQALVLFGKPDTIKADLQAQRKGSKVDDYFEVVLNYPGLQVILTAGMLVLESDLRYMIHGSNGSFVKYGIDTQEDLLKSGKLPIGDDWGKEDPGNWGNISFNHAGLNFEGQVETEPGNYMAFYDNVFQVIRKGEEDSLIPVVEGRNVIKIIELAFESHQQKKEIQVKF